MAWKWTLLPWRRSPGVETNGLVTVGRLVTLVALALALHIPQSLTAATTDYMGFKGEEGNFREEHAVQRFSMGMYFYRKGVLNLRTATASKTFILPRPQLEELVPAALIPCSPQNVKPNCSFTDMEKYLWKVVKKSFNALNNVIDTLPERFSQSLTSSRDVKLPSVHFEPFSPEYPGEASRPRYMSTTENPVYEAVKLPPYQFLSSKIIQGPLESFARATGWISGMINTLRNYSSNALQGTSDALDDEVFRKHTLILGTFQAASFAKHVARVVHALHHGAVSPDLVPAEQQVLLRDEVASLVRQNRQSPGTMSYSPFTVSASRDDVNLYVTLSVEGGRDEDVFDVYAVHTMPMFLDMHEGKGSTRLVNVAPYFAVSKDGRYFLELTEKQYHDCAGDLGRYCPHVFFLQQGGTFVARQSCLRSLYLMEKAAIRSSCYYQASHRTPPISAFEYDHGWLFLTNISKVTWTHTDDATDRVEVAACPNSQCVTFAPCHYTVHADYYFFPARHSNCRQRRPVEKVFYPINLAVVYHVERSNFIYFLIPPDAIDPDLISVQYADIENLRNVSFFTVVDEVVANVSLDLHQGPLCNTTSPPSSARSVFESTADKIMVTVAFIMVLSYFFFLWRRVFGIQLVRTTRSMRDDFGVFFNRSRPDTDSSELVFLGKHDERGNVQEASEEPYVHLWAKKHFDQDSSGDGREADSIDMIKKHIALMNEDSRDMMENYSAQMKENSADRDHVFVELDELYGGGSQASKRDVQTHGRGEVAEEGNSLASTWLPFYTSDQSQQSETSGDTKVTGDSKVTLKVR